VSSEDHEHEQNTPAAAVLSKLFPSYSPQHLLRLSSSELLELAQRSQPPSCWSGTSPLGARSESGDDERAWNEAQEQQNPASEVCDDVNCLSFTAHRRSYMGISSTRAILRAIFMLKPSIQGHPSRNLSKNPTSPPPAAAASAATQIWGPTAELLTGPSIDEQESVNAYFAHIQGIIPLLDEDDFRSQWARGDRSDPPWLALLNMVMALGSIAAGDAGDRSHNFYHAKAREHFSLDFLGNGSLETLQALCLLGGCYLHYKNSPNMAYAVMGAAFRIAIALGLHREPMYHSSEGGKKYDGGSETRRRVWWCLFSLDTWGAMTLGRPTLGRWDATSMDVSTPCDFHDAPTLVFFLNCTQKFCVIATKVQQKLAEVVPPSCGDVDALDREVVDWYQGIPAVFLDPAACPERLVTARFVIQNRYFNLRLLLYRPVLLSRATATRDARFQPLPPAEQTALRKCQDIACRAIDQVASMMNALNKMRVWNASWYLYQASLAVLLSIIVEPDNAEVGQWRSRIDNALEMFEAMSPWSMAASRSRQVVAMIYDTCRTTRTADSNPFDDISQAFDATAWDQFAFNPPNEAWGEDIVSWWGDDFSQGT
jgi:hypothetical protein